MMTIKELYDWAVENDAENLAIGLKYQDGGGFYNGDTFIDICADRNISVTIKRHPNAINTKYVLLS